MNRSIVLGTTVTAGALTALTVFAAPAGAAPAPAPSVPRTLAAAVCGVPTRTSITFQSPIPGLELGSANEHVARTGLSIVKLYIADYALRHGDGSAQDRALAEHMIRYSDDNAADQMAAKYPNAINAEAAEYGLADTSEGPTWGTSWTSTADVAKFLMDKEETDPTSPVLGWMATASPVAADGTQQNWGTVHLPGVIGTKWGWSSFGPNQVASASYGPGFTVSAETAGQPGDETADVMSALPRLLLGGAGSC
ncbi:serine hydrolase [Rhodococcus sp. D2-41]|uniref:hypothetical protein n=1 Tax=Speluncibacter jeojiensis TaxID=2710754 RepID=UPI0024105F74|nr:hypothetical protein [Rhodococcus sp. D2-41]MDG3009442.1 serine hydrolase [Rhodococcus sp. D2-41]